jgi:dTDP-glucose 4,6-dehydratase
MRRRHRARRAVVTGGAGFLGTGRCQRARFVLASTSEVYGDPLQHPQREDYWGNVNPVGPRSVYDEAKRYAEALTTAYREHCDPGTGIARIFNSYGPGMRPHDGRAVRCPDISVARERLGWQPTVPAADGLCRCIAWFAAELGAPARPAAAGA